MSERISSINQNVTSAVREWSHGLDSTSATRPASRYFGIRIQPKHETARISVPVPPTEQMYR
jgi:hypothetical protein